MMQRNSRRGVAAAGQPCAVLWLTLALCGGSSTAQIEEPDTLVTQGLDGSSVHPHLVFEFATPGLSQASRWSVLMAREDPDNLGEWLLDQRRLDQGGFRQPSEDLTVAGPWSEDQRARQVVVGQVPQRGGHRGQFRGTWIGELIDASTRRGSTPGDVGLYDVGRNEFVPLLHAPGFQGNPAGAMIDENGGVAVYDSASVPNGSGGSSQDIGVTRFSISAGGVTVIDELLVSSFTSGQQLFPTAVPLAPSTRGPANHGYFVAWESFGSPGDDNALSSIQGRFLDPDGVPVGSQFQVNTVTAGFQAEADVAALDDGNLVVVWSSDASLGDDTSGRSIQARIFSAEGTAMGPEFQVNQTTFSDQFEPSVAAQANGAFVVAWTNTFPTNTVRAREFAAGGVAKGDEFQVNQTTSQGTEPSIAANGDDFAVVWMHAGDIWFNGTRGRLFSDGFESGDTAAWSSASP